MQLRNFRQRYAKNLFSAVDIAIDAAILEGDLPLLRTLLEQRGYMIAWVNGYMNWITMMRRLRTLPNRHVWSQFSTIELFKELAYLRSLR